MLLRVRTLPRWPSPLAGLRAPTVALALAHAASLGLPASASGDADAPGASAAEEAPAATEAQDAQEEPAGAEASGGGPLRVPAVTVVGSKEEERRLPGSGTFLEEEAIRTQSYDDVNRVLRQVPGVTVRPEDGFGLFPNLSLRGVDTARSAKITIMEDGVLTAPAPYSAPSAYYRPTVGRMSGLEVLKGSSQIRYGPHTTGGVINYLSTRIPEESTGYLRGTFGEEREARLHGFLGEHYEGELGELGFVLEGYFRRTDGFKTIDETPDFQDADETGFTLAEPMLKVRWTPPTELEQSFEAKIGYTTLEADETYLGLSDADFSADPFRRYAASRFDNIESHHVRSYLRHRMETDFGVGVTTTAYYNTFYRNWFKLHDLQDVQQSGGAPGSTIDMDLSNALAGANGGLGLEVLEGEREGTLRVRNNARDYYAWGVDSVANRVFRQGELRHDVSLGLRYHEDRIRRDQRDEFFEQEADGTISSRTEGPPGGGGRRRQETQALAVFLEDAIEWGRWTVRPGLRFEQLWLEFSDANAGEADSGTLNVWAPGLGVTFDATEAWQLFGGIHRGFSVPSPRAALRTGLDEETSIATELGARYAHGSGAFDASATFFYTAFDDLIVTDNVGGTGTGESENVGEVNALGLELATRFDLGVAQDWGFDNPYFLNFTYTRARLDGDARADDPESLFSGGEDGNRVPYIPEFSVNFGTGLEFDQWGVEVSATYVDETYTTASNTSRPVDENGVPDARFGETDRYFVVDVGASWELREGVTLVGGVQNLLDEEYLVSRHPHGPRPGKPRFAHIGLELSY